MLYLYTASDCRACITAHRLVSQLRILRPDIPVTVVEMDTPAAKVPESVIGTPMYLWDDCVLYMGNPDLAELLEQVSIRSQGLEPPRPAKT